ncbi:P-loop containing nucleoside triphosphate hydrolase protein [Paraphysoderma sedebokerense]|nr:P-loop containing nucleoside triphosphate hydrolase protein [Paraphysoderma sedebokerense]
MLPPEVEEGNIEYKLKLLNPSPERFEHLVSQLKWRLSEGRGEALYEIGISDSGMLVGLSPTDLRSSLATLERMANALNADCSIVREKLVNERKNLKVAEVLVRKKVQDEQMFMEIRIGVVGSSDAGKSTLLGVLTHSILDNGHGKSRLNLLKHKHEFESGKTSSISHELIGFDSSGTLINYNSTNVSTPQQVIEMSSKVVTLVDTCGHPKYLHTTITGLTSSVPDYACLIISGTSKCLPDITKEHLGVAIVLKIPVFVCVTKIDVATPQEIRCTLEGLISVLKGPGKNAIPVIVKDEDDLSVVISNFGSTNVIPIFLISSVTGENLPLFQKFLNLLHKPVARNYEDLVESDVEFQIEDFYTVPDVGLVVGGLLLSGRINIRQHNQFVLGPFGDQFVPIQVKSMQRQRVPVQYIKAGQAATLAITTVDPDACDLLSSSPTSQSPYDSSSSVSIPIPVSRSPSRSPTLTPATGTSPTSISVYTTPTPNFRLRRGLVILSTPEPKSYSTITVSLYVLFHSTQLQPTQTAVIYCGSIRQSAKIMSISQSRAVNGTIKTNGHSPVNGSGNGNASSNGTDKSTVVGLKTGETGIVRFKFANGKEWVKKGMTILVREGRVGRMKCVGEIIDVGEN